ncbi:MAG TPA: CDP-alcohol phosphatidyltransferase, partial [Intrasporangium sp.]|nr:CDP-alcohol phosphatidyltransferase [Intrasporangium sp.]
LLAPNQAYLLTPGAFLRIPVEALVVAGLALVLPSAARRVMAGVVGVLIGLVVIGKVLDIAFFVGLDRPFNLVTDRSYFSPMRWLVRDAIGPVAGDLVLAAAIVLAIGMLVLMPLALGRLTSLLARHRRRSVGIVAALTALWVIGVMADLRVPAGEPLASAGAGRFAVDEVRAVSAAVRSQEKFEEATSVDPYADAAAGDLLAGLRGKDVVIAFVESYGRTAVDGSSPRVEAVLDGGTRRLHASGYATRSGFLTSPTLGGLSWLAHSTLQTGLWVSDQGRYDRLLSSNRMSLTALFGRDGWRTVAVMPASREDWPEGERFYRLDQIHDRRSIEYHGPKFGFARMPDQYALEALQRQELAKRDRAPVMAMVELASSHAPWAPLPEIIDWESLGDGSVFEDIHERARSATELWNDSDDVEAAYDEAVAYSLEALISFAEEYGDDDLVLVVVGDHQPATVVSGHGASRDVPITFIAHDRTVVDRIAGWGWQDGMKPDPDAPVWPMDDFRDRFLDAFGTDPP